jgi:hypothetical protein
MHLKSCLVVKHLFGNDFSSPLLTLILAMGDSRQMTLINNTTSLLTSTVGALARSHTPIRTLVTDQSCLESQENSLLISRNTVLL